MKKPWYVLIKDMDRNELKQFIADNGVELSKPLKKSMTDDDIRDLIMEANKKIADSQYDEHIAVGHEGDDDEKEIMSFPYNGKVVRLVLPNMDENINVDRITYIDLNNIVGEILTFPVIVNRIGLLLSQSEQGVRDAELTKKIAEAKFKGNVRNSDNPNATSRTKGWTGDQINEAWHESDRYIAVSRDVSKAMLHRDVIQNTYWACRDKSKKLDALSSHTLSNDDITGMRNCVVNGIKIIVKNGIFE